MDISDQYSVCYHITHYGSLLHTAQAGPRFNRTEAETGRLGWQRHVSCCCDKLLNALNLGRCPVPMGIMANTHATYFRPYYIHRILCVLKILRIRANLTPGPTR